MPGPKPASGEIATFAPAAPTVSWLVAPERFNESAAVVAPSWKPRRTKELAPPSVTLAFAGRLTAAPAPSAAKLRPEVTVEPTTSELMPSKALGEMLRAPPWLTVVVPEKLPTPAKAKVPKPLTFRPVALVIGPLKPMKRFGAWKLLIVSVRLPPPRSRLPSVTEPGFQAF